MTESTGSASSLSTSPSTSQKVDEASQASVTNGSIVPAESDSGTVKPDPDQTLAFLKALYRDLPNSVVSWTFITASGYIDNRHGRMGTWTAEENNGRALAQDHTWLAGQLIRNCETLGSRIYKKYGKVVDEITEYGMYVPVTGTFLRMTTTPADWPSNNDRGTEESVNLIYGIPLDGDYGTRGHKRNDDALPNPDTPEEVKAIWSAALGAEPSITWNSGGGINGFWALKEPIKVPDGEEGALLLKRFKQLTERFGERVVREAADRDLNHDNVPDLVRIMRVPGTVNAKKGCKPVLSTLESVDGPRYTLEELEEIAPPYIEHEDGSLTDPVSGTQIRAPRPVFEGGVNGGASSWPEGSEPPSDHFNREMWDNNCAGFMALIEGAGFRHLGFTQGKAYYARPGKEDSGENGASLGANDGLGAYNTGAKFFSFSSNAPGLLGTTKAKGGEGGCYRVFITPAQFLAATTYAYEDALPGQKPRRRTLREAMSVCGKALRAKGYGTRGTGERDADPYAELIDDLPGIWAGQEMGNNVVDIAEPAREASLPPAPPQILTGAEVRSSRETVLAATPGARPYDISLVTVSRDELTWTTKLQLVHVKDALSRVKVLRESIRISGSPERAEELLATYCAEVMRYPLKRCTSRNDPMYFDYELSIHDLVGAACEAGVTGDQAQQIVDDTQLAADNALEALKQWRDANPAEWRQMLQNAQPKTVEAIVWPDPIPLKEPDPVPYDMDLFGRMGQITEAFAHGRGISSDVHIVGMLSAASAACGGKVYVHVAERNWRQPVIFQGLNLTASGGQKSDAGKDCWKTIFDIQEERRSASATQVQYTDLLSEVCDERIKQLKKDATKADAPIMRQQIEAELMDELAAKEKLEQERVHPCRLWANNTTPEALEENMARQDGRMAILDTEPRFLKIMAGGSGKGGGNPDPSIMLSGYDQDATTRDRITNRTEVVQGKPSLTIGIFAQQKRFARIAADNVEMDEGGAWGRLFYSVCNDHAERSRDIELVPESVIKDHDDRLRAMFAELYDSEEDIVMSLTPEAEELFLSHWLQEDPAKMDEGVKVRIEGWDPKHHGRILRIATLIELYEDPESRTLDVNRITDAIAIGKIMRTHARAASAFIATMEGDPLAPARDVLEWLKVNGMASKRGLIRMQDAFRGVRNRHSRTISKAEHIQDALNTLELHEWIKVFENANGAKDYRLFSIHPSLGSPADDPNASLEARAAATSVEDADEAESGAEEATQKGKAQTLADGVRECVLAYCDVKTDESPTDEAYESPASGMYEMFCAASDWTPTDDMTAEEKKAVPEGRKVDKIRFGTALKEAFPAVGSRRAGKGVNRVLMYTGVRLKSDR